MDIVNIDVAIVGAGGAGLRAAIALAETDPTLRIALISKVYPMRSHTCAAEGGAAGVIKADDSLEHALQRHRRRRRLAVRPGLRSNISSRKRPRN